MFSAIIDWFDNHYSPLPWPPIRRHGALGTLWSISFGSSNRRGDPPCDSRRQLTHRRDAAPVFVGVVVGPLATTNPGEMFSRNWPVLTAMLATIAVVRPAVFILDKLMNNHAIEPAFISRIRWQSHFHVVRQSWTFFQNDSPAASATRCCRAARSIEVAVSGILDAVWYAAVFVAIAVIVLAGLDWTLLIPVVVWLALYVALFATIMPRIARQSAIVSGSRSVMTGRIVDSHTRTSRR